MSITLDWTAGGTPVTEYRVYRSITRFTADKLPAIYATLPGTALTFEDKDVKPATLYYYRVAGVKDGQEAVSFIKPMAYNPDMGPGPKTILRGDWEYGFFGVMPAAEFGSVSKILQIFVAKGLVVNNTADILDGYDWYKYASKGRIIYIHTGSFNTAIPWSTWYTLGIAGGGAPEAEIPQAVKDTYGVVTKDYRILLNDRTYKVRLPESRDKWTDTVDSDLLKTPGSRRSGEFDRTYGASWYIDPLYGVWPESELAPVFYNTGISQSGGFGWLCREMFAGNPANVISRTWEHAPNGMASLAANSTSNDFKPVFELIQE